MKTTHAKYSVWPRALLILVLFQLILSTEKVKAQFSASFTSTNEYTSSPMYFYASWADYNQYPVTTNTDCGYGNLFWCFTDSLGYDYFYDYNTYYYCSVTSFYWNFGDGSTYYGPYATVWHDYTLPGTYLVSMYGYDDCGYYSNWYSQNVTNTINKTTGGTGGSDNVGIENVNNAADLISVYPNPASSIINVKTSGKTDLQLFTIEGKRVIDQKGADKLITSALPNGIYILKIFDSQSGLLLKQEKVIKIDN